MYIFIYVCVHETYSLLVIGTIEGFEWQFSLY